MKPTKPRISSILQHAGFALSEKGNRRNSFTLHKKQGAETVHIVAYRYRGATLGGLENQASDMAKAIEDAGFQIEWDIPSWDNADAWDSAFTSFTVHETYKAPTLSGEWCSKDDCEFHSYPQDNECSCGVRKHHVHCQHGKIIQVG